MIFLHVQFKWNFIICAGYYAFSRNQRLPSAIKLWVWPSTLWEMNNENKHKLGVITHLLGLRRWLSAYRVLAMKTWGPKFWSPEPQAGSSSTCLQPQCFHREIGWGGKGQDDPASWLVHWRKGHLVSRWKARTDTQTCLLISMHTVWHVNRLILAQTCTIQNICSSLLLGHVLLTHINWEVTAEWPSLIVISSACPVPIRSLRNAVTPSEPQENKREAVREEKQLMKAYFWLLSQGHLATHHYMSHLHLTAFSL